MTAKLQARPSSNSNLAFELHLHNLLDVYLQQEESLWKQKSRELWLTTLQKFLQFATCISPRVRTLYTWRTVRHV
jgi:hypothetical protein